MLCPYEAVKSSRGTVLNAARRDIEDLSLGQSQRKPENGAAYVKPKAIYNRGMTSKRRKNGTREDQEEHKDNKNEHAFTFTVSDNNVERLGKTFRKNLLVDTGVTSHIITDKSKFVAFDKNFNASGHVIELADGSKANVVTGKDQLR